MVRLTFILLSIYIFIRGWQALPKMVSLQIIYSVIFVLATASFYTGMFLSDLIPTNIVIALRLIGGYWAIFFALSLLAALFADFLRLLNYWFAIFPELINNHYSLVKFIYFGFLMIVMIVISLVGFRNYADPQIEELNISIDKNPEYFNNLTIIAASDFHLGNIVGKEKLNEWVEMINTQHSDIILLVGDIFDRNFNKDLSPEISNILMKLNASYGVYAVLGNHEYYTDTKEAIYCLERSGIKLLRDEAVTIDNRFVLIGRDDFTNTRRKSLDSLLINVNRSLPLILMDHQPTRLHQAVKQQIDLQISGHLHNGQIYPIGLLLNGKWELAYGHRKIGKTHFFVTSGLGLRRVPIRLGSQSEIVSIRLNRK